jgi:hypothetical protein
VVPFGLSTLVQTLIPSVKLTVVPGLGHDLLYELPETAINAIGDFCVPETGRNRRYQSL